MWPDHEQGVGDVQQDSPVEAKVQPHHEQGARDMYSRLTGVSQGRATLHIRMEQEMFQQTHLSEPEYSHA